MRISRSLAPLVAILFSLCVAGQSDAQTIPFWAFGTNSSYFPAADGSGGPYGDGRRFSPGVRISFREILP